MTNTASPRTLRKKTKSIATETTPTTPQVSPSDIAHRAFELYCARGGQAGGELDDWLRAERELVMAALQPNQPKPRRQRKSAPMD